jgi:hypothetical protein
MYAVKPPNALLKGYRKFSPISMGRKAKLTVKTMRFGLVPDHDGGQPKQINAWFLYTHMVYL